MAMMMSAPVPDWIAEVMRACRSLALTVSSLSVMPVAFLHSCVIWPLSSTSEAGTKSAQRSQWTVVSCARAGARPLARMAARPPACAATAPDPDSFRSLRRAMRAMISSRDCIGVRWNYASSVAHLRAEMSFANYASRSAATPQEPHGRSVQPGAPGDNATLVENTPIQPKPQPQPWCAGRKTVMKRRRHAPRLEDDSLGRRRLRQLGRDRRGRRSRLSLESDLAVALHHADMRLHHRYVQAGEVLHGCPPLEIEEPILSAPRRAAVPLPHVAKVFQATKRATSIRRPCSRDKEDSKRCARQNERCAANLSS